MSRYELFPVGGGGKAIARCEWQPFFTPEGVTPHWGRRRRHQLIIGSFYGERKDK